MPPRLMIIDDEADICELIADVADGRGLEVTTHTSAEAAIAALAGFQPNLIIMDLMMPGIDGVEMLRILAQAAKGAKLCLMSGSDSSVLASARRLGSAHGLNIIEVFEKPLDIAKLRTVLASLTP